MFNTRRRFEDVELLTAESALQLGGKVRERVLAGWDIFGGLHTDGSIWAQYVVRYLPRERSSKKVPSPASE